jgi:phage tail-like protein
MLDVNGTRYHLVFGPQDWRPAHQPGQAWEYHTEHHWVQLQEMYQFTQNDAAATATLKGGQVTHIEVTDQGKGYTQPPTVLFSDGGNPASATATATLRGDQVTHIEVTNPGRGYTQPPIIFFISENGSGVTATATLSGDRISPHIEVTNPGRGYTQPPTVLFSDGGNPASAIATVTLSGDRISPDIEVTNPGQGYTQPPIIFFIRPMPMFPRGSAQDTFGHWYWISEDSQKIMTQWAGAQQAVELYPRLAVSQPSVKPQGDFHPVSIDTSAVSQTLSGLAILGDGYLVAGLPETQRLLVLDLYALDGGPIEVPLPKTESSTPERSLPPEQRFALAPRPQGGLLVLDRARHWVWQLGASLQSISTAAPQSDENTSNSRMTFHPIGEAARQAPPATYGDPTRISETVDAIAIAPLPDGSFWLLDRGGGAASVIWLYSQPHNFRPFSITLNMENLIENAPAPLHGQHLQGYDLAYLPEPEAQEPSKPQGYLFIVDPAGKQAYELIVKSLPHPNNPKLDLKIRLRQAAYYPLRYFASTKLVANNGKVSYLQKDQNGTRWPTLRPLPKQRYQQRAEIVLPDTNSGLDGRDPGCVWHRLCLDASIPPGTSITVETRTTDETHTAESPQQWQAWQPQPTLYQRPLGAEIPFTSLWNAQELESSHTGTWELLFQQTKGRFLQIRLTLEGNSLCTPRIRALRVHYPRFSYLKKYLPVVYQQDQDSMQFLENFLANPEGMFTTIEGMIAQMQYLLDVKTAPNDALDWLASWLGLLLQPAWTDYQRRLLIAHTPYFFQRRGTLPGIMQAVLLAVYPELGPQIFQDKSLNQLASTVRIVEHFLTRNQPGVAIGDPTVQELSVSGNVQEDAKVRAHRFTVMIPAGVSEEMLGLVERIVELEKPAHTAFTVKQYWALFRVGEARLEIDTVLGPGSQFETFRLGQTELSTGTLGAIFPYSLTSRTVIPSTTRRKSNDSSI